MPSSSSKHKSDSSGHETSKKRHHRSHDREADSHRKRHKKSSRRDDDRAARSRDHDGGDDNDDDDEEWVEAPAAAGVGSAPAASSSSGQQDAQPSTSSSGLKRDGWMMDPSAQSTDAPSRDSGSFFASLGTEHVRRDAKKDRPDPNIQKISSKELNTTLISQDPSHDGAEEEEPPTQRTKHQPGGPGSQWRMMRLRKVYEAAEEEGLPLAEVGVDRFGSREAFEDALEERRILDEREERRGSASPNPNAREGGDSGWPRGRRDREGEKRMMFSAEPGSLSSSRSSSFKRPSNVHSHSQAQSQPQSQGQGQYNRDSASRPSTPRVDALRGQSAASGAPSPLGPGRTQTHTPIPSVFTPPVQRRVVQGSANNGPESAGDGGGSSIQRPPSPSTLNRLQARVLRAKLMNAPDAEELQAEYDALAARAQAQAQGHAAHSSGSNTQVEVIPTLDGRGRLYDIGSSTPSRVEEAAKGAGNRRKKEEKFTSHSRTGEVLAYNASDDRTSLTDMLRHEKFGGGMADQKNMDAEFARAIVGDGKFENNLDYFDDNAIKFGKEKTRTDSQKRQFAINDFKKTKQILSSCPFCFPDSEISQPAPPSRFTSASDAQVQVKAAPAPKALGSTGLPNAPIIALGTRVYLSCTITEELVPGHCLIVPIQHMLCSLEGDDDVWDEIKNFQKTLIRFFSEQSPPLGVVFYETVMSFRKQKHTVIECVPMPWAKWDLMQGYFKESLLSSGPLFSTHNKLIDFAHPTGNRRPGFRRLMVPNLPYFMVCFDYKGEKGYGHVIEDDKGLGAGLNGGGDEDEERTVDADGGFPWYFAAEIIGNVLGVEPRKWRRPRKVDWSRNKDRVRSFRTQGVEWTLVGGDESDSDSALGGRGSGKAMAGKAKPSKGYEAYDWTGMIGEE